MNKVIDHSIGRLPTIDYLQLGDHALMNRVDVKYVLSISDLHDVLMQLTSDYRVVTYEGEISSLCANDYYDNPDMTFYIDHHNGKRRRSKVRVRSYVNTGLSYLEIKQRVNDQRTDKKRMLIDNEFMTPEQADCQCFIQKHLGTQVGLHHVLSNSFNRTTLVHSKRLERVTIDLGISYTWEGRVFDLQDVVIIEIKSARKVSRQGITAVLKRKGIRPMSISKYCTGVSALRDDIKSNKFKIVQRTIVNINHN